MQYFFEHHVSMSVHLASDAELASAMRAVKHWTKHEEQPPCSGMRHVLEPFSWPEAKVERVENKHILRSQWPAVVIVPAARTPCEILSKHADIDGRELVHACVAGDEHEHECDHLTSVRCAPCA